MTIQTPVNWVLYLGLAAILCIDALLVATGRAQMPERPSSQPFLMINSGMHSGKIQRIATDRNCNTLATGSYDKTIALHRTDVLLASSSERGDAVIPRILRPPIGPDHQGKIYAVAMSPDGKVVAATGWTGFEQNGGWRIHLFDSASGEITRSLGPISHRVSHLAFSPDGGFLAATLKFGHGLRIWETKSWMVVAEDSDYGGFDTFGLAFDNDGNAYTASNDGHLRRYSHNFQGSNTLPEKKIKANGGNSPLSISVHPKGDRIAVVYEDTNTVEVYSAADLWLRFAADAAAIADNDTEHRGFFSVAWSVDGDRLYAAGRYAVGEGTDKVYPVRVWGEEGRGRGSDIPTPSTDSILHLIPCGSDLAVATFEPSFGLISAHNKIRFWQPSVIGDFRDQEDVFAVSPDGLRVKFGLRQWGKDPVTFDLSGGSISQTSGEVLGLYTAEREGLGIRGDNDSSAKSWKNSYEVDIKGKRLDLAPFEKARSLAIASNKLRFVVGGDYWLRAFDSAGALIWTQSAPGTVWGVNIPEGGKFVIATFGDGTIRWFRLNDGKELLALFVHAKNRRWIAWTPRGYFDASPGAEELIGWQINRGWNKSADFFPASRFHDIFYRPEILRLTVSGSSEDEAIRIAQGAPMPSQSIQTGRFGDLPANAKGPELPLPAVVAIKNWQNGDPVTDSSGEILVEYGVRSPSGAPVTRIYALVGGLSVMDAEARLHQVPPATGELTGTLRVRVPEHDFALSLIAESVGSPPSVAATVRLHRPAKPAPVELPVLYAVIVGVGLYDKVTNLGDFPARDADAFAQQLLLQKGHAFRDVRLQILKDRQKAGGRDIAATKANIDDQLEWLTREVQDGEAVGLVFFSGHGKTESGTSYLLPVDFDPEKPIKTGLNKTTLRSALRGINGSRLLILDACYAGRDALDTHELSNDFGRDEYSITTFVSSGREERSYADDDGSGSFFTRAIVESLKGLDHEAINPPDFEIMISELERWAKKRVSDLIKRTGKPGLRQTPFISKPSTVRDLRLAIIRKK